MTVLAQTRFSIYSIILAEIKITLFKYKRSYTIFIISVHLNKNFYTIVNIQPISGYKNKHTWLAELFTKELEKNGFDWKYKAILNNVNIKTSTHTEVEQIKDLIKNVIDIHGPKYKKLKG